MRRVRLFAVAAASTTLVWNHRGRAPGKNLDILDSVENVNVQASTAEPWEGMNANPFGTRPGFNRRTSFAGSVASTESTMSIMAYVKSLQARIWLSSERGLFYAGSPRRASVEESINPDAMGRFGIDSFIQEQDRELDTAIKHEIERDIGEMTYANDNEFILTDFKEVHQEFTKELEALDFGSTNLGAVLYHKTTALFKSLAPLIARSHRLKTSSRILLEDLGRLHLWEATFEEGQLNAILAESEAIQATVVDLISALIRVLVEYVLPALGQTCTDLNVDEQVKALMKLLRRTEQNLFGASRGQHDSVLVEDEWTNDAEYSIEDAAFLIRSSVDCLMELLPSMERVLASLEQPGFLLGFVDNS